MVSERRRGRRGGASVGEEREEGGRVVDDWMGIEEGCYEMLERRKEGKKER